MGTAASALADDAADPALAPDFSLPALSHGDAMIRLSDYRGKAVYLDFWSSWCAPCREALPLLNELQKKFSGTEFAVVTVNLDTFPADGRQLMEQYAVEYPVASDVTGAAARKFGARTLPASFLIDEHGVLQGELPRMNEQNMSAIEASLSELIEQERHTRLLVN